MSSTSGLMELSELYRSRAELYDHFANAEDAPAKVLSFLATLVCNKTVLDCGCGTGKYVRLLAPFCKTYYAVDVAGDALERAASKAASNVQVISARAEALPLADHSVDVVFGTWVLGTISDTARRKLAIESCLRVLRPGGAMYLVENDIGGEFEYVRGRYPDIALTIEYNEWLQSECGFEVLQRFETHFAFSDLADARDTFREIWGNCAAKRVAHPDLRHRVIVFEIAKSTHSIT